MDLLTYWLLFPAVCLLIFLGLGLLVRRISYQFGGALIVPTGIATAITLVSWMTWLKTTAPVAPYVLAALAAVGLWQLKRHKTEAWASTTWWAAGAGAVAYLLFGASVIFSGTPTFTGYTQIVDIAHQFDLSSWVATDGRTLPPTVNSSSLEVVNKTLNVGYPTGVQSLLGSTSQLLRLELAWAYQPLLALMCGGIAAAAFSLLDTVTTSRAFRAVAAVVVSQASILVAYGQVGGVKELALALAVLTSAAHLSRASSERNWSAVLPLVLCFAAAFSTLSLTALPWLGILGLGAAVLAVATLGTRRGFARAGSALGLFVAASLPTLVAATQTGDAVSVVQNQAELGNLAAPVGRLAASGVWLTPDHRYPLDGDYRTATNVLACFAFGLATVGAIFALRRRKWDVVVLGASAVVALAALIVVMGPWVELKAFAVTAPICLLFAAAGLAVLYERPGTRVVACLGVGVLLAAVLVGDALRYRSVPLAPFERFNELASWNKEFAGTGPTLLPDFEEQGEYFGRSLRAVSPVNPPASIGFEVTEAARKAKPGVQFTWDLDELNPSWLHRFALIVTRRSYGNSRPPAGFRLIREGRHYLLWARKTERAVRHHAPLSSSQVPADRLACENFRLTHRRASVLTIAPAPATLSATFDPGRSSANLPLQPGNQVAATRGPGTVKGVLAVPKSGRYEVYVGSSSARSVTVRVDGRTVAAMARSNSYAYRPYFVGEHRFRRGKLSVSLTREGGSLRPGQTDIPDHTIGPVVLVPAGTLHPPLRTTTPGASRCQLPIDWVEASLD
jgi:hypothetical protein